MEHDLDRKEFLELNKKLLIWEAMPLESLQYMCMERRIPIAAPKVESVQHALSLVEKLFIEDRKAFWDAKGFEATRIDIFNNVLQAVRLYESYVRLSDEDL